MKRQRSYGDGLDDDRRRFHDRVQPPPPPPPPPRRPPREYEGDNRIDRRKGFGGGGSYDSRYQEYPSPREYGGDRALHRSESFSGFRREFPKGFRSERDRHRRDGDGSSAWRRPGGGWRDAEGQGDHRAPARLLAASLPATPRRSRSRSRSPIGVRRRVEAAKSEKLRKRSASIDEVEEGEVAPDAEHKIRAVAVEHRKQVEPSRAKERGRERGEVRKVEPGVSLDSGSQCKGVTGASHSGNAGSEEVKRRDGLVAEVGKSMENGHEKSALKVEEEGKGRHELQSQNVAASDPGKPGLSTSAMQQEVLEEKVKPREEPTNSTNLVKQSASSSVLNLKEVIQEDTTSQAETSHDINVIGKNDSSSLRQGVTQEEAMVLHKTDCAADEVEKNTSPVVQQEVRQEHSLVLNGTGFAVDEVGKGVSSNVVEEFLQEEVRDGTSNTIDRVVDEVGKSACSDMVEEVLQEEVIQCDGMANAVDRVVDEVGHKVSSDMVEDVLQEEVMQRVGTANAVGRVEIGTSVMLQETMQKKRPIHDEITNTIDNLELVNYSGLMEEVMHDEDLTVDGMVTTTDVMGQEVVDSLHQEALENKELVTVIEEKIPESTDCVASRSVEEGAEIDHCESRGAPVEATLAEGAAVMHENVGKQVKIFDMEVKTESANAFLQPTKERSEGRKDKAINANLITREAMDEDKGNGIDIAFDVLGKKENIDLTEPVGRGIDSTLQLHTEPTETSSSASTTSLKQEYEAIKIGKLDLSLSLSGVDQMRNCGQQAQVSSESTQKGGSTALFQRAWQNGHVADNTFVGINWHSNGMSKDLRRFTSIPGVSQGPGLEHSRFRRQLTRERSSSSLTRDELKEGQQVVINGSGVVERVISKVISEPFHLTARMLHEMTENSIRYLREAISEIIVNPDKRVQIIALQEALKQRSDLNSDMLRTCPKLLMEILVAIRTGIPHFVRKSSSVASSDLVDIFLNLKCCNISCQSVLPVDGCDCKICQQGTGFCSSCMCIVCSKFDLASNTCSWVGCDVCLHWCHTDCGLRHSLIRKGKNSSRAYKTTDIQFHCVACGHPSEMFGFVKEVFRTCARQWSMDTLARELQYVERIFSCGDDARGKRVWDFVKQMLIKLENRAYYPEVMKCVITFFSDDGDNLGTGPSEPLRGIPCSIAQGVEGIPSSSRKAAWKSYTLEGLPVLEKGPFHSSTGSASLLRKSGEAKFHADDNKPVIDELDSVVRLKQAEACLYQERANDARSQADDLRHIVMVKTARIEEDFATRIAELNIKEVQERHKQKIEELQAFERKHRQFFSMKTRMEASIRELLLKMEEIKENRMV